MISRQKGEFLKRIDPHELEEELEERVIRITPVDRVRKGGRTRSWNALVVVGNGRGVVGMGFGKASEVPEEGQSLGLGRNRSGSDGDERS